MTVVNQFPPMFEFYHPATKKENKVQTMEGIGWQHLFIINGYLNLLYQCFTQLMKSTSTALLYVPVVCTMALPATIFEWWHSLTLQLCSLENEYTPFMYQMAQIHSAILPCKNASIL